MNEQNKATDKDIQDMLKQIFGSATEENVRSVTTAMILAVKEKSEQLNFDYIDQTGVTFAATLFFLRIQIGTILEDTGCDLRLVLEPIKSELKQIIHDYAKYIKE